MDERIINMAINRCIKRKTQWLDDLNWTDEQNDTEGMKEATEKIEQEEITILALKRLLEKSE